MKTQKEIYEKLKEVEGMMRDNIPNEKDITELKNYVQAIKDKTISDDERMSILLN